MPHESAREVEPNASIGPTPFPTASPPGEIFRFHPCGVTIEAPREILAPEIWEALSSGSYEADELAGLIGVIRPGDCVLELGAGLGFIATFIARALRPRRVVSVEADPRVAAIARRTHALNDVTVELRNTLVAAEDGEVDFHLQPAFWGSSTTWLPDSTTVRLAATAFRRLLADVRPEVLIIDIEGSEDGLFDGVDLTGVRAISLEIHRRLLGLAGIRRLFMTLGEAGFAYEPAWSKGPVVVFGRA
jgi:FkbM family methyltransferase